MNTITITTPENIEINYRLAGVGSRMAAVIIDLTIIMLAIILLIVALVYTVFGGSLANVDIYNASSWAIAISLIVGFTIFYGYFIISEMSMKGQSIGKKILKLRVIRQNGRPVTFFESLIRNLFRYFIDMIGIGVVCIFFNKHHKRVGDMVAGTVVVAENPKQIQTQYLTLNALMPEEKAILTNKKYAISAEELALLKEYFNRKNGFLNNGEHVRAKLIAYFSKKFDIENGRLDETGLEKIMTMNQNSAV